MVIALAAGCDGGSAVGPPATPTATKPVPARAVVAVPKARPAPVDGLGPELHAIFGEIASDRIPVARAKLDEYLQRLPDDGGATFLMGLTYHREKRYAQALPYFQRAADLVPDYKPVWHFLGWCRYWLGDMEGARAAFERHLKQDTTGDGRGDSIFALGLIDLEEDRLEEAEVRFTESIEIQADNPKRKREVSKAHARIADICVQQGRLAEAQTHLETSTGLWPEHYAAFYKLYQVRLRLGKPDEARVAYDLYQFWQNRVEARGVPFDATGPAAPGAQGRGTEGAEP